MHTKICGRCKQEFPKTNEFFRKRGGESSGLRYACKQCDKVIALEYETKVIASRKECLSQTCTKCGMSKNANEFHRDKKKLSGLSGSCKKCIAEYQNIHEVDMKAYADSYKTRRNDMRKFRRENDRSYRILEICRKRIWDALKGVTKSARTVDLIGCSIENLVQHIENQFEEWMNWDNYGKWHIDHIIPCASFDLADEAQQRLCFHFTNLQPLEASENMRKGCKII